jgi:hypothetical protein
MVLRRGEVRWIGMKLSKLQARRVHALPDSEMTPFSMSSGIAATTR